MFEEEKEGSVLHRGMIREIGDAVRGRAVVVVVETDVRRARRSWGDGVCMMASLTIDLCLLVEKYVLRRLRCEAKQNEILQLMSETEPFRASGLAILANQMRWNTQHDCHTNPNYILWNTRVLHTLSSG